MCCIVRVNRLNTQTSCTKATRFSLFVAGNQQKNRVVGGTWCRQKSLGAELRRSSGLFLKDALFVSESDRFYNLFLLFRSKKTLFYPLNSKHSSNKWNRLVSFKVKEQGGKREGHGSDKTG